MPALLTPDPPTRTDHQPKETVMTMGLLSRDGNQSYPLEETFRGAGSPNADRDLVASDHTLPLERAHVVRHPGIPMQQSPARSPGKTGSQVTDLSASPYTHLH